jgi:hypothetical protein
MKGAATGAGGWADTRNTCPHRQVADVAAKDVSTVRPHIGQRHCVLDMTALAAIG